jgi:hypothetical protein
MFGSQQRGTTDDAPTELSWQLQGDGVLLSWNTPPGGAHYKVWRDGEVISGDDLLESGSYLDAALTAGTYRYAVQVFYPAGYYWDDDESEYALKEIPVPGATSSVLVVTIP